MQMAAPFDGLLVIIIIIIIINTKDWKDTGQYPQTHTTTQKRTNKYALKGEG